MRRSPGRRTAGVNFRRPVRDGVECIPPWSFRPNKETFPQGTVSFIADRIFSAGVQISVRVGLLVQSELVAHRGELVRGQLMGVEGVLRRTDGLGDLTDRFLDDAVVDRGQ